MDEQPEDAWVEDTEVWQAIRSYATDNHILTMHPPKDPRHEDALGRVVRSRRHLRALLAAALARPDGAGAGTVAVRREDVDTIREYVKGLEVFASVHGWACPPAVIEAGGRVFAALAALAAGRAGEGAGE